MSGTICYVHSVFFMERSMYNEVSKFSKFLYIYGSKKLPTRPYLVERLLSTLVGSRKFPMIPYLVRVLRMVCHIHSAIFIEQEKW